MFDMSNFSARGWRSIAAALSATALASACAVDTGGAANDERPLVLTTFTVLADMTREVAGDVVRVESMVDRGAEVHGFEFTPSDLRTASEADLVLRNGLGLEPWFDRFSRQIDVNEVVVTDGIEPIGVEGDPDRPNPHAWMSPRDAETYVDGITRALSDLEPDAAETFEANAREYKDKIRAAGQRLNDGIQTVPEGDRILVTCEGAFPYLARDAGLEEHYLWPVNAEAEGTPQQIARVTRETRDTGVPAVFCESTVSDAAMRQVAITADTELADPLYVDSLTTADGPAPTYLDLLERDTDTIVRSLGGTPPASTTEGAP